MKMCFCVGEMEGWRDRGIGMTFDFAFAFLDLVVVLISILIVFPFIFNFNFKLQLTTSRLIFSLQFHSLTHSRVLNELINKTQNSKG